MLKAGAKVHCASGPVEVGGRIVEPLSMAGRKGANDQYWVNICVLGQHLPQVYRERELTVMYTEKQAQAVGLCGDCFGFGTNAELQVPLAYPAGIDEIDDLCTTCEGTGREWVRTTIQRDRGSVIGALAILPHDYQGLNDPESLCFRCSVARKDHSRIGRPEGAH